MPHFSLSVRAPSSRVAVVAQARRVPDYSARRSGGDPENQRRRSGGSFAPPAQSYSSPPSNGARANPAVLRRKSVDYASRRSGGEQENNRRRSGGYSPAPPARQAAPAATNWGSTSSNYSAPASNLVSKDVIKRRSADYASRRSGGEGENNRRRSGGGYSPSPPPRQAAPAASSWDSGASSYGGSSAPASNLVSKQVLKRRSVDYSARRSGGREGRSRSNSSYSAPVSSPSYGSGAGSPAPGGNSNLVSPQVLKRRSMDYSARRSGGRGPPEGRSRSNSSYSSPSSSSSYGSGAPASNNNLVSPAVLKRRSMDYSARRSGGPRQGRR